MGQIGQPVRRYTVIPLEEPVSPTAEPVSGYRSEFGKIVSLDYGDPELLDKFRKIYRVNHVDAIAR